MKSGLEPDLTEKYKLGAELGDSNSQYELAVRYQGSVTVLRKT